MKSGNKIFAILQKPLLPILILIIAAFIYSQYGFHAGLDIDTGIYLYSGQMMTQGIPPYISIFDHKGPLAPMLSGLGVFMSKCLSWNDIYTVRIVFFILCCLAVASIYFLGKHLFQSQRIGFFGALTFLGFFGFTRYAASGPRAKTPMVLFQTLSLLLTSRKKWFWAGFFGSLSFINWQPMLIFPIVTIFLAITSTQQGERIKAVSHTLIGIAIPIIFTVSYFIYHNALNNLFDGAILFNVRFLDHGIPHTFKRHFWKILKIIYEDNACITMSVPIFIGSIMILYIYIWRTLLNKSFKHTLTKDAFAPILLTFPAPVIWSIIDFQRFPDFYVFLPYISIAFAKFLDIAIKNTDKINNLTSKILPRFLTIGLSIVLIAIPYSFIKFNKNQELHNQIEIANEIETRFGKDVKLITIGIPEIMVILHRKNPFPYLFIIRGIDSYIQTKTPGGFDGFIRQLEDYSPDLIAFNKKTRGECTNMEKLNNWLNSYYYEETIGPWTFYIRNSLKK